MLRCSMSEAGSGSRGRLVVAAQQWRAALILGAALAAGLGAACGTAEPRTGGGDAGAIVYLPDGGGPACRGNGDGVVSRDEVVFAPGVTVRYRINPGGTVVAVDTKGEVRGDGTHLWDFSDTTGELVELTLLRAQDGWYQSAFDGAQYAARLDPRNPLLGVYRASDTAVELLGVVGETESVGTKLKYDTPIRLLQFPLTVGQTRSQTAQVLDGRLNNVPFAARDTYQITVDATGELRLGILTFPKVVRVRVEVVQQFPAGPGTRRIQYLWMSECYGEVARVTSKDGELDPNFHEAVEFRRLGL